MAFNEPRQSAGNPIPSAGWNRMIDEITRLGRDKLDTAGGTVAGPLTVQGVTTANALNAGDGTLTGALAVNGPATLRSALNVLGAVSAGGTATVAGAGAFGSLRVGAGAGATDAAEIDGIMRLGTGDTQLRFTSSWTGFPDTTRNRSEIANDTGGFKRLMIVGNKSDGGTLRRVGIWDTVTVGQGVSGAKLEVFGQSCAQQFCNLSDGRLKTGVTPIDDPLGSLGRLRGVSFRWREGDAGPEAAPAPSAGDTAPATAPAPAPASLGVIAQEVAEVFPGLVSTMGEEQHLAVDYGGLVAVLIEAVKQLAVSNHELRRRVTALEGAV
jgi:hypothetical protein